MKERDSVEDSLTEKIIECIIKVHSVLGPGFVEGIYQQALLVELKKRGLKSEPEKEISVSYHGQPVGTHRLDILVADSVIIEIKAIEELGKSQYAQVRSYLKATRLNTAILVNFSKDRADFRRVTQGG